MWQEWSGTTKHQAMLINFSINGYVSRLERLHNERRKEMRYHQHVNFHIKERERERERGGVYRHWRRSYAHDYWSSESFRWSLINALQSTMHNSCTLLFQTKVSCDGRQSKLLDRSWLDMAFGWQTHQWRDVWMKEIPKEIFIYMRVLFIFGLYLYDVVVCLWP